MRINENFILSRSQESGDRMRRPAQSFQDLIVWQKAHQFVLGVYGSTNSFQNNVNLIKLIVLKKFFSNFF